MLGGLKQSGVFGLARRAPRRFQKELRQLPKADPLVDPPAVMPTLTSQNPVFCRFLM